MITRLVLLTAMLLAVFAGLTWSPTASGFVGESSRIVFFHVPLAWAATLAYLLAMVWAGVYLKHPKPIYDLRSSVAARLGFFFSILATVTGSIFAKVMWGAYWNWDPRETSIVILLFIYAAYLVLRSSVEEPVRRAHLSSVYALFAFIPALFLIFIIPRIYTSLHPDTFINAQGHIKMQGRILVTFLFSLGIWTLLFLYLYKLECRIQQLMLRKENRYE